MAAGLSCLCGVMLPATTLTDIYVAPMEVALSSIVVCNHGGSATSFRLSHAKAGVADAPGQYFVYDAPIVANQMVPFTIGVCLGPDDVLRAYAGNDNLSVVAWGELSTTVEGGGASTFLDLLDTPDLYTGQAGKLVLVNPAETALEFGDAPASGLDTEAVQDTVAAMFPLSTTLDFAYNDPLGVFDANVRAGSITETHLLLADVTADNATTGMHGFLPKLSGIATEFMNGVGGWTTPAGGGGGLDTEGVQDVVGAMATDSATIDYTYDDTAGTFTSGVKDGSVTVAKLQTIAASRLLGRGSAGTGAVEVIQVSGAGLQFTGPVLTLDVALDAIATANPTANTLVYFTGTNTAALQALTAAGRALLDDADNTAQRTTLGLGTLAQQNADAVAITGGAISIGGHAPTGVLDVQGSVVASDIANQYYGVRVWPVGPSGATNVVGVNIEAATGAGVASSPFYGVSVKDQPTSSSQVNAYHSSLVAGTNRFALNMGGTAPSYLGGSLGIGTVPAYPLDVAGNMRVTGCMGIATAPSGHGIDLFYNRAVHGILIKPSSEAGGGTPIYFLNAAGTNVGHINTTTTATTYNTASDVRLKRQITPLVGALEKVKLLCPITYLWKADDSPGEGFLAHKLQEVIPLAVTGEVDAVNEDGTIRPQQVDPSKIVPWLAGAIQELSEQVQTLTAQVASLKRATS